MNSGGLLIEKQKKKKDVNPKQTQSCGPKKKEMR